MKPEPTPESGDVEASLAAWRRKATDVLLIAVVAGHLPVIVQALLGYGPRLGRLAMGIAVADYLVAATVVVTRGIDYRVRLSAFFLATYCWIAIANLVLPRGAYASVGVVAMPVLVLVLLGARAARIAVLTSAAIIVTAPWLRVQPGVIRELAIDPARVTLAPGVVWMEAFALMAMLVVQIILLDRFHSFLVGALTQRVAAQHKVENEMRERHRLEREIAALGDGERRRLGHELHDGVLQQFTAALLHSQVLRRRSQSGEVLPDGDFQALSVLLSDGIGEARNIARGLCPLDPDPEALAPALQTLTKRIQTTGTVRCEFMTAGDVRVPDPAMAQHLYRIAQEALSNAVRHAHASRIALELRRSDSQLILLVEDDGTGLPPELPAGGMGLHTMAYRARMLDGVLNVASAPGGGTRIECRVPLPTEAHAKGHAA